MEPSRLPTCKFRTTLDLSKHLCLILDFDSLQVGAQYEGHFHADHQVVTWLWEVLEEFDLEQKKVNFYTSSVKKKSKFLHSLYFEKFLSFSTGN